MVEGHAVADMRARAPEGVAVFGGLLRKLRGDPVEHPQILFPHFDFRAAEAALPDPIPRQGPVDETAFAMAGDLQPEMMVFGSHQRPILQESSRLQVKLLPDQGGGDGYEVFSEQIGEDASGAGML